MAPRTIWKGSISFGLVTIPIRLHSAIDEKSFRFNQLHGKDQGRIKYKRTCAVCAGEVPFDEIVRGYEYEKDHYVVLSEEELDRGLSGVRAIDILRFVPAAQIDPIYWQRSYYLTPDNAAAHKAYRLLTDALSGDERVAVAKIAFRDKEHLATLRVRDGVFVLETMYWPDEIRAAEMEPLDGSVKVRDAELAMARQLIDSMTGDFDPTEYVDTYREKVEGVVQQKIEGKEIAVVEEAGTAKVLDLMDALKASLEAAGETVDTETGEIKKTGTA